MQISGILKPSKKKIIVLGVVAVLIGSYFLFRPKVAATELLQYAPVKRQNIAATISSSGKLTGKDVVDLKFKSGGKLAYINVKVGDRVKKGSVIAGLDTQQLAIDLRQAQNTYQDKQALAQKAEDDAKNHDKDETFTQKATRTTAQIARDNAYDSVKEAQRAFQDIVIISPISGIITKADLVPGQIVSSDIIAQVVDVSEIFFDIDIDETDIDKISLALVTEVTLDSYPERIFYGNVEQILPVTSATSSGATIVTTRVKLLNFPDNFIAGLNGQASVILEQKENVLTIPLEALKDDGTVAVKSGNSYKFQKVASGIKSDTEVEIESGLGEEDSVALNPPATVRSRSQSPLDAVTRFLRLGGRGNR